MSELETMMRTQVAIDGGRFLLAGGQDPDELKRRIESAAMTRSGTFVDFLAAGDLAVSVLVSSATKVVISVETVTLDPRETDDESIPFGSLLDF